MSDSTIPPFNPSAIESANEPGRANRSAREDNRVDIIRLPENLREVKTPRNVKGEVIRAEKEGNVTVRTDQGTVELHTKENTAPKQGETVVIRIPSGKPPVQAHIRPTNQPIQTQNTTPETEQQINIPQKQTPLQPDTPITLKPLSAQNVQRLTQPFIETLPQQALVKKLKLTAQTIQSTAISALPDMLLASPTIVESPAAQINSASMLQTPLPAANTPDDTMMPEGLNRQNIQRFLPLFGKNYIQADTQTSQTSSVHQTAKALITDIMPPQIQLVPPGEEGIPPITNAKSGDHSPQILDGKPESIKGQVIGFTPEQHFPVLRLTAPSAREGGVFTIPLPANALPMGTVLELTPQQNLVPPQAKASLTSAPATLLQSMPSLYFTTPENWPLMQEMQQTIAQISLQAAQSFSNITPSPANPANFGPAAMFFLAAVRSGDLSGWLGDRTTNILKSERGNLFSRLTQELSSLSRFVSEQPAQDWRSLSLPLAWDNEIHKIVLHYRKEDRNTHEDEEQNGQNTRFVLNLSLSNVGPVQLDALFQSHAKRLDLILRTENDFSAAMKAEMRHAYKSALDETSITGELSFQDITKSWVKIQAQSQGLSQNI